LQDGCIVNGFEFFSFFLFPFNLLMGFERKEWHLPITGYLIRVHVYIEKIKATDFNAALILLFFSLTVYSDIELLRYDQ